MGFGIKTRMKKWLGLGAEKPPMWHPDRGEDYKEFWTSMSATDDEALMATYGKPVSDEERVESCRYIADYIVDSTGIDKTKEALEVGCGIGTFSYLVGPLCKRYVGVDISSNMVRRARAFAEPRGGNLEFHTLERSDLGRFADETFDVVFFESVLMHLAREDCFNYLCEAHRVLRPNGRVYASFQNVMSDMGFKHFLRLAELVDKTGRGSVGRVRFHTGPELRHYAAMAGFEIDEKHSRLRPGDNDPSRHEARTISIVGSKTERPDWGVEDGYPV